jgi:hypothetical protein
MGMVFQIRWAMLVGLLVLATTVPGYAQQKQKSVQVGAAPAKSAEETAERKAVLLAFVEENHPDLKRLLRLLEERNPNQFRKATRTLSRQYDRLQAVKNRDAEKYEIALQYWKVQSRIEVVSAKIALYGPEKFGDNLKTLLGKKQEVRLQLQKYEVSRTQERLNRQRESLQKLRESKDFDVERQYQQILNRKRKSG